MTMARKKKKEGENGQKGNERECAQQQQQQPHMLYNTLVKKEGRNGTISSSITTATFMYTLVYVILTPLLFFGVQERYGSSIGFPRVGIDTKEYVFYEKDQWSYQTQWYN